MVTHMGSGLVFKGQPRPRPKAAGPQRSPILGVPLYLCVHPLSQNYQISRGNTCRKGRVSLGQPRLPSQLRKGSSMAPNFRVLHLCLHPLTQTDQKRHSNTDWEGRVLGQPRHCICANASRDLSAIAEFLVTFNGMCVAGGGFLKDCPVQRFIPIYLFVAGFFGLFENLLGLVQSILMNRDSDRQPSVAIKLCSAIESLLGSFMIAWFIAG